MTEGEFVRYCKELINKYGYPYMGMDLPKKIDYRALRFPLSGVRHGGATIYSFPPKLTHP